jgi:hypothetical protein
MKKTILLILFLLTITQLRAPEYKTLYIEEPKPIELYAPLIDAITWVESKHGKYIWNPLEGAVGWFQIRQVRVDDYNKKINAKYKLDDFYDYNLSKEMFLYYTKDRSFEIVAKEWNGSGKMTINYWKLVKQKLNEKNLKLD